MTVLGYGVTLSLLYFGWLVSQQNYFTATSGTGYWLGILGACMMLLLLVYPVRKRKPNWAFLGSIKFWFRFHMFLGVSGPLFIIWHSGYHLGSLNGSVAFFSMIIVAVSGLIGRYLYRSIHHGLYGEKIQFNELYNQDEFKGNALDNKSKDTADIEIELAELTERLIQKHTGINRSLSFYRSSIKQLKRIKKRLKPFLKGNDDLAYSSQQIKSLQKICHLGINEIYFSYWHILHLPLFIILIASGLVHVFVVHFYS